MRERLRLSEATPGARTGHGAAGDPRLPRNYTARAAPGAGGGGGGGGDDYDDDDAGAEALAIPEVGGGADATAARLARLAGENGGGGGGGGGEGEGEGREGGAAARGEGDGTVVHLPPANGSEDTYTLLKMYTLSSHLVGGGGGWGPREGRGVQGSGGVGGGWEGVLWGRPSFARGLRRGAQQHGWRAAGNRPAASQMAAATHAGQPLPWRRPASVPPSSFPGARHAAGAGRRPRGLPLQVWGVWGLGGDGPPGRERGPGGRAGEGMLLGQDEDHVDFPFRWGCAPE